MPDDSRDASKMISRRLVQPLTCTLPNQNPHPHGKPGKRHLTIWTYSQGRPTCVSETELVTFQIADPEGTKPAPTPAPCPTPGKSIYQLVRPMVIAFPLQYNPAVESRASLMQITIYSKHFEAVTVTEGQTTQAFCWDDDENPSS